MPDLVDVIVVGSGAAGASAAFHLAARGRRVTLLERQSHRPLLGLARPPLVNVLAFNLALDQLVP
jgi:glycine/D-amino acid oxidase-like deaminating enzyme